MVKFVVIVDISYNTSYVINWIDTGFLLVQQRFIESSLANYVGVEMI